MIKMVVKLNSKKSYNIPMIHSSKEKTKGN